MRKTKKVIEVLRLLLADGWYIDRTKGDHRQLKHSSKPGLVTLSGKESSDIANKTLRSMEKQSGLEF